MDQKRPNFATEQGMETSMPTSRLLKAMTIFGVTIFVSLSALATGSTPSLVQSNKASTLSQGRALPVNVETDKSKLKTDKLADKMKSIKKISGGDGSGGGDSAEDSKGQRRLLDLIEQDELDYFTHLYDRNQESIRKYLVRLHFVYFSRLNDGHGNSPFYRCGEIPYKYWHATGGNETFVKVLLKAYGLENSTLIFDHANFSFCPESSSRSENYKFGSISPNTKVLKWAFTDLPLESINDEGEIRISKPDSKKQLAIQKDGLVVINRAEFNTLDDESKAALFTHEALLYTVSVLNPDLIKKNGTRLVRFYNRKLLRFFHEHDRLSTTQFPITLESVIESFQALEIPQPKK